MSHREQAVEDGAIRIIVRWDVNRTNPNQMQSLHWAARRRLEQAAGKGAS